MNGVEYFLGNNAPVAPTVSTVFGSYGGAGYFSGTIDEARISSTARSADWIKTEYLNQSAPKTFYSLSPAGAAQARAASVPAIKSRGGVIFH